MTMNRAQRRSLKRTVAHAIQGGPGLAHPVPDSVVLSGGPMDGWIVKPDAPALDPVWRAEYLEEAAIGEYQKAAAAQPTIRVAPLRTAVAPPPWEEAPHEVKNAWRHFTRAALGAGRYQLAPGGKTAAWVAE